MLIFGAAKLPALAKSVGQSMRILRGEMKSLNDEKAEETVDATPPTSHSSGS